MGLSDRQRIYAAVFLRAISTAMTGILLGLFLARVGLPTAQSGLVIGLGLAGAALASLLATARADAIGKRRFLVWLSIATAVFGALLPLGSSLAWLAPFALLGMVNGMGRDRGAALVLEQAMMPSTVTDAERTRAFAWYNVLQDAGGALGALGAALPVLLREHAGLDALMALRVSLAVAALLGLVAVALYASLSERVEVAAAARVTISPATRRTLTKISALFFLDGFGGGFLTSALLSYFFFRRFGVDERSLAPLFFGAKVLNALSHFGAAWLARRIGLVNTMVFTHIPSSLLLLTVAIAPTFPVAALLFLLREGLAEMDVPTRQSYVMAVVRPEERTFASGVTSLVRLAAWACGPAIAGVAMQGLARSAPLVAAAGMKISYDLLLWRLFRKLRPPEETGSGA